MNYLYIMRAPGYKEELIKIGQSHNAELRQDKLSGHEAVPYPLELCATYETPENQADILIHAIIDILNPELHVRNYSNGKLRYKEFFKIPAKDACDILVNIATLTGTMDKLKIYQDETSYDLDKSKTTQGTFSFNECGIEAGELIYFVYNDSISAKVIDDNNIEYDGKLFSSLSALSRYVMGSSYNKQGPQNWTYKGQRLSILRLKSSLLSEIDQEEEPDEK